MPIDILADEGVNHRIISNLREKGQNVISVAERLPGATDSAVLEFAVKNSLLLLTEDRDFGELVFAYRHESTGVIYIRYSQNEEQEVTNALLKVLRKYSADLRRTFTVVTSRKIRIRPLPEE